MLSPIVSSTLQATALASTSNIIAQLLDHHNNQTPSSFFVPDFLRFAILTLITAPPNFLWQHALERAFPGRRPLVPEKAELPQYEGLLQQKDEPETKLDWKNTMIKWFVDCMTLGALLNTSAFLIIMGLMKLRSMGEIGNALRTIFILQETLPIIFASYKIWPLASVVNFALIPVEKRIVFLSAVGLVWGVFMSLTAAKQ